MIIVDSCGWLEWFSDGVLARKYQKYLENKNEYTSLSLRGPTART